MNLNLEDTFLDIIAKARAGKKVTTKELSEQCNCSISEIRAVLNGEIDPDLLSKIAEALNLNSQKLLKISQDEWIPKAHFIDGLKAFQSSFMDFSVNSFLVWDPDSLECLIFDTGTDAKEMIDFIKEKNLKPKAICITHNHIDHIADLDNLLKVFNSSTVYIGENEAIPEAQLVKENFTFKIGRLQIKVLLTNGHSPGGITYFITGLEHPVAIVGDSIFAGSMGGGKYSYELALKNNKEKILTLPEETIICPGHGPMTTVGEEISNNPFF